MTLPLLQHCQVSDVLLSIHMRLRILHLVLRKELDLISSAGLYGQGHILMFQRPLHHTVENGSVKMKRVRSSVFARIPLSLALIMLMFYLAYAII